MTPIERWAGRITLTDAWAAAVPLQGESAQYQHALGRVSTQIGHKYAARHARDVQVASVDDSDWFAILEWLLAYEQPYWLVWPRAGEPPVFH
jgi:hypothetical protein